MKRTERNARGEGYLDGLEGRPTREIMFVPDSYSASYKAGYSDGMASRERMRQKLRDAACGGPLPLRGSTEEEARNPDYRGEVTGRWSGRRFTGKRPELGMPYGGKLSEYIAQSRSGDPYLEIILEGYRREFPEISRQWNNWHTHGMRVVRMVAGDLVDENSPSYPSLERMEVRDAKRRAWLELQALVAHGKIMFDPLPTYFIRGEEMMADAEKSDKTSAVEVEERLKAAMENPPAWGGFDLGSDEKREGGGPYLSKGKPKS